MTRRVKVLGVLLFEPLQVKSSSYYVSDNFNDQNITKFIVNVRSKPKVFSYASSCRRLSFGKPLSNKKRH